MAVDMFLKIKDAPGESLDAKHPGEIQILSVSWGVSNPSSMAFGAGAGSGKANFQDIVIAKKFDKASPKLQLACANGKHFDEATLTIRKAGESPQEFLTYKLEEVYVTSVSASVSDEVLESVTLQAAKITLDYKAQKADGKLDTSIYFKGDIKKHVYTA